MVRFFQLIISFGIADKQLLTILDFRAIGNVASGLVRNNKPAIPLVEFNVTCIGISIIIYERRLNMEPVSVNLENELSRNTRDAKNIMLLSLISIIMPPLFLVALLYFLFYSNKRKKLKSDQSLSSIFNGLKGKTTKEPKNKQKRKEEGNKGKSRKQEYRIKQRNRDKIKSKAENKKSRREKNLDNVTALKSVPPRRTRSRKSPIPGTVPAISVPTVVAQ